MKTRKNLRSNRVKYVRGLLPALFVVAGLIAGPAAHAAVIINDDFNRTGNLNGSTASPSDTAAGAHTWSVFGPSGGTITTDGSAAQLTASPPDPSFELVYGLLPFHLSDAPAHSLITLSADVTVNNTTDNAYFVIIGFSAGSTGPHDGALLDGGPWMALRANGQLESFTGPGVSGTASDFGTTAGAGTSASGNLKIIYNEDSQVASFYLNNTLEGSLTVSPAPTINDVIIEAYGPGSTASVDNLFVSAVPEPASLSLLALGGALLFRRRR